MTRPTTILLVAFAGASLTACTTGSVDTSDPSDPGYPTGAGEGAAGGSDNTFNHPDVLPDVWDILARMQEEGPPDFAARVHACRKMSYGTVGAILTQLGVNVGNTTALSAGALYKGGAASLGAPNYNARIPESADLTTAGASKLYDIFAQAAPEIIAAMPTLPQCGGAQFFDASNACTAAGIECLTGMPSTPAQVELCGQIVLRASTPDKGRTMAVAITAAAAHTCE